MHEHLADQPLVTVSDAYRAVLILADGTEANRSFAERQARLTERGIIRSAWNLEADDYIDRGSVAFMIAKVAGVTGGINRVMLGSWGLGDRRYALRELQYRGLIAGGTDYAYLSGGEMLGILHRADAHLAETGSHDTPPLALPLARDPSTFASPPASQPAAKP